MASKTKKEAEVPSLQEYHNRKLRLDLMQEVRKLARYIYERRAEMVGAYGVCAPDPDKDGFVCVDVYDCREERSFSFNPLTGEARLSTWQTSGHNGDPYGEETRNLGHEETMAELHASYNRLEQRALQHEVKLLKEREAKSFENAARKNLKASLRSL